ncbi:hypothetical protein Patl1_02880 [Pistacia atlantica]|uniref:Uncharacterized protein n=1 Tax=Pistacia atlantica TaxID=434234 RepID=A0ACC1CD30_9ROSI|nr:hypothetical protein Patl1_02880 [Pistacia atlantica]
MILSPAFESSKWPPTMTPPSLNLSPPSTTTISVKLAGSHNYLAWKMQFLNLLQGHNLVGFIDGTVACPPKNIASGSLDPAYVVWQKKDVCLLGWILASLLEKFVSTVYGFETSMQVWTTLQTRFSSQSRSRISHLKHELQTLTQGTNSCSEYLENAKSLADQLATAGKPVDDQDLISFLLGGLQSSYTPFITSFTFASRETDFTFEDFQAELLGYENLLDAYHSVLGTDSTHFTFSTNKSKAPTYVRKKGPPLPPTKLQNVASSNYRPHRQTRSTSPQLPNNIHGRFPPQDLATIVAETNATFDHQVWYMDICANAHITSNATNITHQLPFRESETENLTSKILLQGVVENGLYPLAGCKTSHKSLTCLSATIGVRDNADIWHSRLGHHSSVLLESVLSPNDPSPPSVQMPLLAASNSTHQSPPPTSNDYSNPLPTLNSENPIEPDIVIPEIVIPPIFPSPQVPLEPDNTSNNPIVQSTSTQIQTRSKTDHSPKIIS